MKLNRASQQFSKKAARGIIQGGSSLVHEDHLPSTYSRAVASAGSTQVEVETGHSLVANGSSVFLAKPSAISAKLLAFVFSQTHATPASVQGESHTQVSSLTA